MLRLREQTKIRSTDNQTYGADLRTLPTLKGESHLMILPWAMLLAGDSRRSPCGFCYNFSPGCVDVEPACVCFKRSGGNFQVASAKGAAGANEWEGQAYCVKSYTERTSRKVACPRNDRTVSRLVCNFTQRTHFALSGVPT